MKTEYLKELVSENIKNGATTIYVKFLGAEFYTDILIKDFVGIEFDCFIFNKIGKTIIEKEYIPIDKIVHFSFQKRIKVEE